VQELRSTISIASLQHYKRFPAKLLSPRMNHSKVKDILYFIYGNDVNPS
jgi:hypothetical protein